MLSIKPSSISSSSAKNPFLIASDILPSSIFYIKKFFDEKINHLK